MTSTIAKASKLLVSVAVVSGMLCQLNSAGFCKTAKSKSGKSTSQAKPLPPEYGEAIKAFNDGKYKDALTSFQHLDATGNCCDKVHYYIAQTYQGMNQTVLAQQNYAWVITYSKDPTLTYYSQMALDRLAYYQGHRTYKGQGNNFSRVVSAPIAAYTGSAGGMRGG